MIDSQTGENPGDDLPTFRLRAIAGGLIGDVDDQGLTHGMFKSDLARGKNILTVRTSNMFRAAIGNPKPLAGINDEGSRNAAIHPAAWQKSGKPSDQSGDAGNMETSPVTLRALFDVRGADVFVSACSHRGDL